MTSASSAATPTVHIIGNRPASQRRVVPLLKRISFVAFLGATFWAVPQALDVGMSVYTEHKTPSVDAPVASGPAVWMNAPSPTIWHTEGVKGWKKEPSAFHSFLALESVFRKLKMTDSQKMLVAINYKVAMEEYVLGSDEPVLRATLEERNANARQWLEDAWVKIQQQQNGVEITLHPNDIAREYLEYSKTSLKSWVNQNSEKKNYDLQTLSTRETFSVYPTIDAMNDINMMVEDKVLTPVSPAQAREQLRQAVQEVGLGALVVPGDVSRSPLLMQMQAKYLRQANVDLRRATGLNGPVLGLNKRVVLHNEYIATNGRMETMENGYLWIKSMWDTLGHEWFHAVDAAQATAIRGRGQKGLVSQFLLNRNLNMYEDRFNLQEKQKDLNTALDEETLSKTARRAFKDEVAQRTKAYQGSSSILMTALSEAAAEAVKNKEPQNGSNWWRYRQRAAEIAEHYPLDRWAQQNHRDPNDPRDAQMWAEEREDANMYLRRGSEKLAFVFQGHLEALYQDNQTKLLRGEMAGEPGLYVPTLVESRNNVSLWNQYFISLEQWWNTDQSQRMDPHVLAVSSSQVKNWQEKRAEKPSVLPPLPVQLKN